MLLSPKLTQIWHERDAGSCAMVLFMATLLRLGFNVKFWPHSLWYDPDYAPSLQAMGIGVYYGSDRVHRFDRWLAASAAFVRYVLLSRPHIAVEYLGNLARYPAIHEKTAAEATLEEVFLQDLKTDT